MRLFVYGSLLSGEGHNGQLGASRLVGAASTEPVYTLVDLGPYPALLADGTTSVSGEIYDVDADVLAALDDFEGHPDEYRRMPVRLIGGDGDGDGGGGSTETYVMPREKARHGRVIASGSWRAR
jgi:gamma-glutamylaminecyclotransferase